MREKDVEYLKKYLDEDKLEEGISLLEQGMAPQYIVGNVDFYGNVIEVNSSVLIPRFETELLVDKTISYIKKRWKEKEVRDLDILDIGTGSGCIAITLKKELDCKVVGVDISDEALMVAKKNALNNQVEVLFLKSDLFSEVNNNFDVIISNPPYIREDEEIEKIVYDNEPHLALFAKEEGVYFYEMILKQARIYLKDNFLIAFEIGDKQGEIVRDYAFKYLENIEVFVEKDYSNKDRFVFIYSK